MYIQCFSVGNFDPHPPNFLSFMQCKNFAGLHVVTDHGNEDEAHSILADILQCFDVQPYHKAKPRCDNGMFALSVKNKRRGKKTWASIRRTCRKKGIPCFYPIIYSNNYYHQHVVPWIMHLGALSAAIGKYYEDDTDEVCARIIELLGDDFLPAPWSTGLFDGKGLLIRDGEGYIMPWTEIRPDILAAMRIVLTILCNIFRLCAPTQAVAEVEGAMIIADFDQQLEAEWQVKLMPWLLKYFPKVQFIIDTRNPEVIRLCFANGR